MESVKLVIEKHPEGYVAYPLGLKGVVVGEGDTYEEALQDVKSAIRFHVESFGPEALEMDSPILEVFLAESPAPCSKVVHDGSPSWTISCTDYSALCH